MNLLFTITSYPPSIGGTQLYLHLLAQQLYDHHAIQVVSHWDHNRNDWLLGTTFRAPLTNRDYVIDNINVHRIGLSKQEKLYFAPYVFLYYPFMDSVLPLMAQRLATHLAPYAEYANLIHNVRQGRETLSYASLYTARKYDIPFVLTPAHHPRWKGWLYRAYSKLYTMADMVIALTNVEKQTLMDMGVHEDHIAVTGMGPVLASQACPEAFRLRHKIDGPIVLFVGRHDRYKGYRQVLQAANFVWKRVPETHFVFVGPPVGKSECDFEMLEDRRIHRLGAVDLQEKTNALAACDVLALPSTQESFGGVYVEAWSFAKPVIGCDIPAVSEVISDAVDGYLVEQDPAQIAERICHLLLNPEVMQTMGEKGRQKVAARFTWSRLAELTEQAYCQSLDG